MNSQRVLKTKLTSKIDFNPVPEVSGSVKGGKIIKTPPDRLSKNTVPK